MITSNKSRRTLEFVRQWLRVSQHSQFSREVYRAKPKKLQHLLQTWDPKRLYTSMITADHRPSDAKLTDMICSIQTPVDVTNIIDKYLPFYQNHHIVHTLNNLDNIMYNIVRDKYSWALTSKRMLCVQSFISNDCHKLFLSEIEAEAIQRLFATIVENSESFSNEELLAVTHHLIRLHVNPSSDIVCTLLTNCIERCPSFDIKCLTSLAATADHLGRSGFYLSSLVIQNFSKKWESVSVTPENFNDIASLISYASYFCPAEFLQNIVQKFSLHAKMNLSTTEMNNLRPKSSLHFLEALGRFGGVGNRGKSRKLAMPLLFHLEESLSELNLQQVHKIIIYLKLLRFNDHAILPLTMQRVCNDLKSSNLRPAEVVSLIGIFDFLGSTHDQFNRLEELFLLHIDQFDSILLKDVSRPRFLTLTRNANVINSFCNQIIKCMPDLLNSLACLVNIISIIPKLNEYPAELDTKYATYLLNEMHSGQIGLQTDHLHMFGRYLLHCSDNSGVISPILSETLLPMLPQMSLKALLNLNDGILRLQNRVNYPQRIEFLRRQVSTAMINRLPETNTLNGLNTIVRQFTLNDLQRESPHIIPCLIEKYSKFAPNVNITNVLATSSSLAEMKLHIPEILQRMADCILENENVVTLEVLTEVLRLFSFVNYVPDRMDLLQNAFINVYRRVDPELNSVINIVLSATSLSTLGFFSDLLINRIFSVDFLLKFDKCCAGLTKSRQLLLKQKLCTLNRSVVLRQPHLNIPWFHGDFCRQLQKQTARAIYSRWKNEVRKNLWAIVEDKHQIRDEDVVSEYYHKFDFEVTLDNSASQSQRNTKVAILVLRPTQFCSNNHQLLGAIAAKINELEILEYKVVTIPYYKLDSMELSDQTAMKNYFETNLFGGS